MVRTEATGQHYEPVALDLTATKFSNSSTANYCSARWSLVAKFVLLVGLIGISIGGGYVWLSRDTSLSEVPAVKFTGQSEPEVPDLLEAPSVSSQTSSGANSSMETPLADDDDMINSDPVEDQVATPALRKAWWLVEQEEGSTTKSRVSLKNRWWLHGTRQVPWRWRLANTTSAVGTDLLSTESGWNMDVSQCDDAQPFKVAENPFKNASLFIDRGNTAAPHYATCLLDEEFRCPRSSRLPEFEFVPKRTPYTLADTILVLVNKRLAKKQSDGAKKATGDPHELQHPIHIMLVGDSALEDVYNWAKCHLSRTSNVNVIADRTRMFKMGHGEEYQDRLSATRWFRTSSYMVNSSVEFALTLARNDVGLHEGALSRYCLKSDMVVLNWGLHFQAVKAESYENMMRNMIPEIDHCNRIGTTVVYLTHPAQHFPYDPNGWYATGHPSLNRSCVPFPNSVEDSNWILKSLRKVLETHRRQVLVPTPWISMGSVVSNGTFCRRPELFAPHTHPSRIHMIPYFDISASLWNWHLNREHIALRTVKSIDCTHLVSIPSFGTAIWDGLFWAAFQESMEQHCGHPPPTRFFTGRRRCGSGRERIQSSSCQSATESSFRNNAERVVNERVIVVKDDANVYLAEASVLEELF